MSDAKPLSLFGDAAAHGRREAPSLSLVGHAAQPAEVPQPAPAPLGRSDAGTLSAPAERLSAQQHRLIEQADPVMGLLYQRMEAPQGRVVLLDLDGRLLHAVGHLPQLAAGPDDHHHHPHPSAAGHRHSPSSRAALLLSPEGDVAAQLDWVAEAQGAGSAAAPWVSAAARLIENRWLCAQHQRAMRIHFHRHARALGGLSEGILAVSPDERIVAANRQALELLGMGRAALRRQTLKSLLGVPTDLLLDHFRAPGAAPVSLQLPDGRSVLAHARSEWPAWSVIAEAAARQHAARTIRTPVHWAEEAPGWPAWLTGEPTLERMVDQLRRLAGRDIPLVIEGEAGTGKSWLARTVHAESPRSDGPFVAVSCALRPLAALETDLFGAPVGPTASPGPGWVTGKLLQADGGTLFLDDIDALPAELQQRLATFIRTRQLQVSAGTPAVPVDVAVIAGSRRWLMAAPALGEGSAGGDAGGRRHAVDADLYHALNGWTVRLPALRERQDLPALVRRLLDNSLHAPHQSLSEELLRHLQAYHWPGNVGQLVQVMRSAALQAGTQRWIKPEHLPPVFWASLCEAAASRSPVSAASDAAVDSAPGVAVAAVSAAGTLGLSDGGGAALGALAPDLEAIERAAILRAVEQAGGNVSLAARRLGVSRNTVYRRLRLGDAG